MSLTDVFVEFAEDRYSVDWAAIQRSVEKRLSLNSSLDVLGCTPRQRPSYWYVPLLVGDYVGASRNTILEDTEGFVTGCVVRHYIFEWPSDGDRGCEAELFQAVCDCYSSSRVTGDLDLPFDERFSVKCLPWIFLVTSGTQRIFREAASDDYAPAMRAIVLVHSCLQILDDWHDKSEDVARSHWNMWVHAPTSKCLSIIEPLWRESVTSVARLRPHLLRRILEVQMQEIGQDLRGIITSLEIRNDS